MVASIAVTVVVSGKVIITITAVTVVVSGKVMVASIAVTVVVSGRVMVASIAVSIENACQLPLSCVRHGDILMIQVRAYIRKLLVEDVRVHLNRQSTRK
jgi:hypothetical protein